MSFLRSSRFPSGHGACGKRIDGKFLLTERLGEGRNASVYKAVDPAGRSFALKLGDPNEWDNSVFRTERDALSRFDCKTIVKLVDGGVHEGAPYLVMERIEGRTLREAMHERRFTLKECAAMGIELCNALSHAHSRGVVHRDLKPKNIMGGSDCSVKLFDFGFALVDGKGVTSSGRMGNPLYMAPEQCATSGPCDARTDIFSAGVTLLHLACNSGLGGALRFLDMAKLLAARLNTNLVIDCMARDCRRIAKVMARAMAQNPKRRFQTADEMQDALADAMDRLPDRS